MKTLLADENISALDEYFHAHDDITVIKLKGRQINQSALDTYKPDGLLIRSVTPINGDIFNELHQLKFIGSATIGTDHVNENFLKEHHITFANAKGSSKHSVAQYVITAILSHNPDFINQKITLGIIGLGNIGSTLAKYANDLGWHILGYDPYLNSSNINNSSFDNLLSNSDIISIHTPLTKIGDYPTYQLFDKSVFAKLKDNTLLINSARGEIIHQDDLLNAIENKNLQVILDVFPFEPVIDKSLLDKLILATPHIAGYTLDGKLRGADMIYQAVCKCFNLPILQTMTHLLPPNPFGWQTLKDDLKNGNLELLKSYYDIKKDDSNLRAVCIDKVSGTDFDTLRRDYELKREWIYD